MVAFPFHGRIYRNWVELIGLIYLSAVLAGFVLREVVNCWHNRRIRRSMLVSREPVGNWTALVLKVYTAKILRYYTDNKQLPSTAELQQMQREAIEHTPTHATIIAARGG